jgi:hypothetical protein
VIPEPVPPTPEERAAFILPDDDDAAHIPGYLVETRADIAAAIRAAVAEEREACANVMETLAAAGQPPTEEWPEYTLKSICLGGARAIRARGR